jgi:hypothetical protein
MPLGTLLIRENLIDPIQLDEARHHQKMAGGDLVTSLLTLELISPNELDAFLGYAPVTPTSLEATGLDSRFLLEFLLRAIYLTGHETIPQLSEFTKLSHGAIGTVFEAAKNRRLIEVLGVADSRRSIYRHALTGEGRQWALDALSRCKYAGPAPVPLAQWQEQVLKQSITRDHATPEALTRALDHLVLADDMVSKLGPAANSGRAVLLYGGVGNGKTSIAEAIGNAFSQEIWIPHCVELDGQIIKIFDTALHRAVDSGPETDARWVRCERPVAVTGGELSLEMLDLSFDETSQTYEAPLHVKATGGTFIIDDFGRQRVRPQDLLNRWIFPLERRVDFLTMHTGKKVELFFDQLVVFSTNFAPGDLMDDAGLRRIPYKFDIAAPAPKHYIEILQMLCESRQIAVSDQVATYLLDRFYPKTELPLSASHPAFIVDHVLERCRFDGRAPEMSLELVREAAQHLIVDGTAPEADPGPEARGDSLYS